MLLLTLLSCGEESNTIIVEEASLEDCGLNGSGNLYPLAENPQFTSVAATTLPNESLVGIVNFGTEIRVYPYDYTYLHEVINDQHGTTTFAFTYCPLTKSSVAFTKELNFRASGYLLNDNLIPWDEKTESLWSQMLGKGLECAQNEERLNTLQIVETQWSTVKAFFPNAKVLTDDYVSRIAAHPRISQYRSTPSQGNHVYGFVNEVSRAEETPKVRIFKYSDFATIKRYDVAVFSKKFIVCGDETKRVINAFNVTKTEDYTTLPESEFPYVLAHSNGTKFTILGMGTDGSQLPKVDFGYVALWGSWNQFYTDFEFVN
jgi:hypothetical protein